MSTPRLETVPEGNSPPPSPAFASADMYLTQSIDNYMITKEIGRGNFARVNLAIHRVTGVEVAIKVIHKPSLSESFKTKVYREIEILKKLDHPNIVKLYEVLETSDSIYLVMEYASGGEVFDYLVTHGRMKEKEARARFRQLLSAVEYCHAQGIVHRDLKAENVLFDKDLNIKIADFGFANFFHPDDKLSTYCGSPPYAAPELFKGQKYDGPKVDAWSLGVILYTIVSGSLPFDGANVKELRARVLAGRYRVPFFMSDDCEKVLRKLLAVNVETRCRLKDIMNHPWINSGYEETLEPFIQPEIDFDDDTVHSLLATVGFQRSAVIASLESSAFDHRTAAYLLLLRADDHSISRFKRISSSHQLVRPQSFSSFSTKSPPAAATVTAPRKSMLSSAVSAPRSPPKHKPPLQGANRQLPQVPSVVRRHSTAHMSKPRKERSQTMDVTVANLAKTQIARTVAGEEASKHATLQASSARARRRTVTEGGAGQGAATEAETNDTASVLSRLSRRFRRGSLRRTSSSDSTSSRLGAKPRSLRFTFSMNNTSSKDPEELLMEMKRVLDSNEITYKHTDPFTINCQHGDIIFEMEVCKLPRLQMNGIRHKRIGGDSLQYKNILTKVLNEASL